VSAGLLDQSILREERWLRARFGDRYDTYRAGVARYW
jgi:protein-S-isoprenylcysteine O-methyltransferase Ste14